MTKVSELVSSNVGVAITNFQTWGGLAVNVKAYGAKGNWVVATSTGTDDTIAIQAAITYAISIGKKEVYFPSGTYKYTTLTNTSGMTFIGDGVILVGTTTITLTSIAALSVDVTQRGINVDLAPYNAVGDGVTDDKIVLQAALDWSKANKKPIYLADKRYYVSGQLDAGGAIIRSFSGKPGNADPYLRKKPDGTYVTGSADWNYFYNSSTEGRAYTWAQMIADTSYGCAIVSDYNGAILFATDGHSFDIDGVATIGNHRKTSQDGIATAVPLAYSGNAQSLNNISVIGCGRHGINLERGLETSVLKNVRSSFNMGHGLRTGYNAGINSATEYIHIEDSYFTFNRLCGVYYSQWRKAIKHQNCDLSGNGQYSAPIAIDPLLGYDRTVPATATLMQAGVWVNDSNLETDGRSFGFVMDNNYGEVMAVGLHLRANFSSGIAFDVKLQNNSFIRASNIPNGAGQNGCVFYIDIKYGGYSLFSNNYNQALDMFRYAQVPARDTTGNVFCLDGGFPASTSAEKTYAKFNYPAPIGSALYVQSTGRTYGNQVLFRDVEVDTAGNIVRTEIATDFTLGTGNGAGNVIAMYSLTAHWQTTGADTFGGYLLIVTLMPSGHYVMLTIAMSGVGGFTGAPTMSTTGSLTIPASAFYRFTLTRIDNQLTNATP